MDLYEIFRNTLVDKDLCSSDIHGGKYILAEGPFYIKVRDVDISVFDKSRFKFSLEAEEQVKGIYTQFNELSMTWWLPDSYKEDLDLQKWFEENGFSEEYSVKDINGTINIVTPTDMFDRKKFGGLEKNGVQYLPFDLHYGLAICFKVEDQIKDNLYLFNTEDSDIIIDMKIGCQRYLQLAYEAKLLYHWQHAYLAKNGLRNQFLHAVLPEIFPFVELDLSGFK